jgi:hypothetical protein
MSTDGRYGPVFPINVGNVTAISELALLSLAGHEAKIGSILPTLLACNCLKHSDANTVVTSVS